MKFCIVDSGLKYYCNLFAILPRVRAQNLPSFGTVRKCLAQNKFGFLFKVFNQFHQKEMKKKFRKLLDFELNTIKKLNIVEKSTDST